MIFTKRNAIVGYATLKALEQYRGKRRKKERRALRIAGIAALAAVSVGILAGVAVAARKHAGTAEAAHGVEPSPDAGTDAATAGNGRVSPEPAPAA